MPLNPIAARRVATELHDLLRNPIEGVQLVLGEASVSSNLSSITAHFTGPESTPFEGGLFCVELSLQDDFPSSPPRGRFLTRIFHPNIAPDGDICVDAMKRGWRPDFGLRHLLLTVRCLLIHPNPESALNAEAGRLLLDSYEDFCSQARIVTQAHARRPSVASRDLPSCQEEGPKVAAAKLRRLKRL